MPFVFGHLLYTRLFVCGHVPPLIGFLDLTEFLKDGLPVFPADSTAVILHAHPRMGFCHLQSSGNNAAGLGVEPSHSAMDLFVDVRSVVYDLRRDPRRC